MVVYNSTRSRKIYGFFMMPLVVAFLLVGILLVRSASRVGGSTPRTRLGVLFALGRG